ncbi:MAG: aminopeptidase [Spirochaetota bacterium]
MTLSGAQLERYAEVLLWGLSLGRRKPIGPYEEVLVNFDLESLPLAEVLHRALTERRINVVLRAMPTPIVERNFFRFSDRKQRKHIPSGEKELYGKLSGSIYLHAPSSLTHLQGIDPKAMNDTAVTRKAMREILNRREDKGLFGWTLCTYPTEALAAQAGLSINQYAGQVVKACMLNERSPVSRWEQIFRSAGEVKKWLNSLKIDRIRIESQSMDLLLRMGERRIFIGVSGRNIPSFEIFTSPDWRGARGEYYADQPSFRNGNFVEKVRLIFENGKVTKATAARGQSFLRETLAMDPGATRIGEFSLTDKRFSKIDRFMADTLFDENYGGAHGNCHIALGSSYTNAYAGNPSALTATDRKALGFNQSALHWDLVNTERKRVSATLHNGKTICIYDSGEFRL